MGYKHHNPPVKNLLTAWRIHIAVAKVLIVEVCGLSKTFMAAIHYGYQRLSIIFYIAHSIFKKQNMQLSTFTQYVYKPIHCVTLSSLVKMLDKAFPSKHSKMPQILNPAVELMSQVHNSSYKRYKQYHICRSGQPGSVCFLDSWLIALFIV